MQAHNGSLFPAAVVTFYCTYLCYSSMISEPHDYICNGLGNRLDAASASTLAAGMFLALLSVVYSALRAGSNTALFGFGEASGSESGEAMESLMEAQEEESTSAGLDGEAEAKRTPGKGKEIGASLRPYRQYPDHLIVEYFEGFFLGCRPIGCTKVLLAKSVLS